MVAELGLDRDDGVFTLLQLGHRLGEFLHEGVGRVPAQVTAVGTRSGILGQLGQRLEALALLQALDDLLGLVLGFDQDVAGLVFLGAALGRVLDELLVFGLDFGVGDGRLLQLVGDEGADQHVLADLLQLLLDLGGLLQAALVGFLHEQLAGDQLVADHLAGFGGVRPALLGQDLDELVDARGGDGLAVDDGGILRHGGAAQQQAGRQQGGCTEGALGEKTGRGLGHIRFQKEIGLEERTVVGPFLTGAGPTR